MKLIINRLFEFYIHSSIHVALAVLSLFLVFVNANNVLADANSIAVVFLGSITGYNFTKYASIAKLYHRSLTKSLKVIQIFSLACFVLLVIFLVKIPMESLIAYGFTSLITFLYAIPVIGKKNIRSVGGVKIYVVAICWSVTCVIFPALYFNLNFNKDVLLSFVQVFLLVVSLIIPFDIRDLEYDNNDLRTLPQKIGIRKAKQVGIILMSIFFIIELFFKSESKLIAALIIFIAYQLAIWYLPNMKKKYYCSFWIEGIPIVYYVATTVESFLIAL